MSRQLRFKEFVQNVLGCTCPDKVFEQIDDRRVVHSNSPHHRSITIGGRLLVYIWNVRGADSLKEDLPVMLEAGKKERDERGLSRFRAVLAVENSPHDIEAQAQSFFTRYAGKDDRIHMHVIPAADIKGL